MITVFTPTYNRGKLLSRLYKSLLEQTFRDFEWLIVDDGSSDDTESIVKELMDEGKLQIRYFKRENGGKHRAINKGVGLAKGELFFIVDSDDYLLENSLQLVWNYASDIMQDESFAGVAGSKCNPDGRKIGSPAKYNILDTDSVSYREKYKMKGDEAEVFKTDVLKKYPFPEFSGEKFVTEDIVINEIAKKYKLRHFNTNIYVCDYLQQGLTLNIRKHHRNSPRGTMLYYSNLVSDSRYGWNRHIRDTISFWRYTWRYKGERPHLPLWARAFYPIGVAFYCLDKLKGR